MGFLPHVHIHVLAQGARDLIFQNVLPLVIRIVLVNPQGGGPVANLLRRAKLGSEFFLGQPQVAIRKEGPGESGSRRDDPGNDPSD